MSSTRDLVNQKLNINTTSAKGIEKAIGVIATFVINAQSATNGIIYGKYELNENEGNLISRAFDKGIVYILEKISTVDFCNLVNYLINQIPGGKPFNPNDSIPSNPLARKKWQFQKLAFDIQKVIDGYFISYGDANNPESRLGLYNLIQSVRNYFTDLIEALNDPEIKEIFPEVSIVNNFITDKLSYIDKFGNVQSIPVEEFQKLISTIEKTRAICILAQSINSPASLLAGADLFLNGQVQEEIAKLNREIPVQKIIPVLKNLLKSAKNISSTAQKLVSYINSSRSFIRLFLIILKVFYILRKFLFGIPVPNVFTTAGVTTLLSNVNTDVVGAKGIDKLVKRLQQINFVLNLIAIFATSLVAGMQIIIDRLNIILNNLQACTNVEDELKKEIEDTIKSLQNSIDPLKTFLDQFNSRSERAIRNIGEYNIEIITEDVTDEGISIRRRYGIARDTNGYIVVQSTPTFASLDLIIINEVKFLLYSKGLVKSDTPNLSPSDLATVLESSQYLDEDEVSLSDLESVNTIFEESKELGISSFIDNLSGGKALKKRVKKALAQQNQNLTSNLGSVGEKYASSIIPPKNRTI
jgi:hypothetical protein